MKSKANKAINISNDIQTLSNDDPDLIAKLTEIAQKVAVAQGKARQHSRTDAKNFTNIDPMEELGCEGCQ